MTKLTLCTVLLLPISLAGILSFLLGCISPGARDLAIYRVNITKLATELVHLSVSTKHNVSDLVHPDLPSHWYFGLSGICDFFADGPDRARGPTVSGTTHCRRAFPPNVNVLSVVHDSLRANVVPDWDESEKTITAVMDAWKEMYGNTPASLLRDGASAVNAQNRAAAALAILSMILDLANVGVSVKLGPLAVCVVGLVSTVMVIISGVLTILAMNGGMHGVVRETGHVSGSLVFLFIAALMKLPAVFVFIAIVCGLLYCCLPNLFTVTRVAILGG
ncbi:hypothetical protein QBC34DRAFT_473066 [Podospora aff. communis PSN243]|uniref:Uncharacterized protein n=1 Tax=Podospora aff. communis PSN243 TaxID=3040156 RepID=A0AAV9GDE6_9PEZI|nr:hypothetical protein QBC34DRAFT_473066 [Podospora aff. communis PSN243]